MDRTRPHQNRMPEYGKRPPGRVSGVQILTIPRAKRPNGILKFTKAYNTVSKDFKEEMGNVDTAAKNRNWRNGSKHRKE